MRSHAQINGNQSLPIKIIQSHHQPLFVCRKKKDLKSISPKKFLPALAYVTTT